MNKVPFALELDTQKYVDVHDVKRGLQCNCICPSCKTPLSAKQGEENAWHFAHATRSTSDQTVSDCEYSFYVSVTQMAKQLFLEKGSISLSLPEYRYCTQNDSSDRLYTLSSEIVITEASIINLQILDVESKVSRHPADVQGQVSKFPFIIGFIHPEKVFHADPELLDGKRAGIIGINLTDSISIFDKQNSKSIETFKDALSDYLFDEAEHISWLYHPRESEIIKKAKTQLLEAEARKNIEPSPSSIRDKDFIDRALEGFYLNRWK